MGIVVRGLVLGWGVVVLSLPGASARVWTDAWGRKYEGDLIKVSKEGARMKVKGVLRVIPFKNFSSADIGYLKSRDSEGHMKRVATREELRDGSAVRLRGGFKPRAPQLQVDLKLEVKVAESNPAKGRWVYRSPHFEFVSNAYLGTDVVREFSWMFEVTHDYLATLPVQLPRLRDAAKRPMRTYLFSSFNDYVKAGGPPTSAGVYPYALMVFYYFARLEGAGDGTNLKEYAEMLLEGHPETEARKALMAGRSYEAVEKDLAKAWGRRGIVVNFR